MSRTVTVQLSELPELSREQYELVPLEDLQKQFYIFTKDTKYTKLALMPLIDDNLGHTFSGLTQIGNIIAKIFLNFTIYQQHYRFPR